MIDFIIIVFISLGAIVMGLAIAETQNIFTLIKQNKFSSNWKKLFYLMIFFLFGYILFIFLSIIKLYSLILFLTGLIFLFGSMFVFLVVKTGFLTIQDLVKQNDEIIKINTVTTELKKEKQTSLEITKLKSEFLTKMSHELEVPVQEIINLKNTLLTTELNLEQQNLLTNIQYNTDYLLHIIHDLLYFSEIESGNLILNNNDFSLQEFIDNIFELVKPQAELKQLEIFYSLSSNVPTVINTDKKILHKVLVNLICTALKSTDTGTIILTIKMFKENLLLFTIKDTGKGLKQEELKLIFEPFSSVELGCYSEGKKTGLGLLICKELVELMGGTIWVESKLGQGSTFFFTISI